MKILCDYAPAGPHYVRSGWGHAFVAAGHEFWFWDRSRKSAFDAFGEREPDLYLGTTYDLDRAVARCIAARPHMRVALFGSAWGELVDGLGPEYPVVKTTEAEKRALAELKRTTGRPDFVFIHVTGKYLEPTMGGWRSIGITPVGVLNAADTLVYCGGKARPELACDVGMCGGYWGYKARNLDRYVLPLCQPRSGLDVKLFGNQPWPVPQYLGMLDDNEVADLFRSARICINVSEPHSTDLGFDVIERVLKVPAAGGCLVSDHVDEIDEVFGKEVVPMAKTPADFRALIDHYLAHPEERAAVIQRTRSIVLGGHTYFHRVAQILGQLGLTREAAGILETYSRQVF